MLPFVRVTTETTGSIEVDVHGSVFSPTDYDRFNEQILDCLAEFHFNYSIV